jgi:alpha-L-fucosidase
MSKMQSRYFALLLLGFFLGGATPGLQGQNKPEHEAWLQDAGFGMFIHWSLDVQLGTVISHSLVGASEDYVARYFQDLPKTFNPGDFNAERIATLAKLAGMKYMVFTAKHHNGFCMWNTQTTDFNIMQTPYQKDVVKQYVEACRAAGLKVGLYFSPEDFWFLKEHDQLIKRRDMDQLPEALKAQYIAYVKAQCKELMTQYGKIDILFFDGRKNFLIDALKPFCWELNPDLLVTRGEIQTPEQHLLGTASEAVWESCMTMGTQWQYKPTHETYKTAGQVLNIWVQTRATGGSLLLNIGPDPYGTVPFEQERNLREIAAWYFINQEAVNGVRPWVVSHEGPVWFTKAKAENTVYAVLFGQEGWQRGERRAFTFKSLKATAQTTVEVLGQNDQIVEYSPVVPASHYTQTDTGLTVSIVRAQRIYNNHQWPNAIVVKITEVEPALEPPLVKTFAPAGYEEPFFLQGELLKKGDATQVATAFEYRPFPKDLNQVTEEGGWRRTNWQNLGEPGRFSASLGRIEPGVYQYRAVVKHPALTLHGEIHTFQIDP